jgi:hypothetical protein
MPSITELPNDLLLFLVGFGVGGAVVIVSLLACVGSNLGD